MVETTTQRVAMETMGLVSSNENAARKPRGTLAEIEASAMTTAWIRSTHGKKSTPPARTLGKHADFVSPLQRQLMLATDRRHKVVHDRD